jgi:hypothetical protein
MRAFDRTTDPMPVPNPSIDSLLALLGLVVALTVAGLGLAGQSAELVVAGLAAAAVLSRRGRR